MATINDQRPTINERDIQDILDNLVERSLVICDPITGRYHLSESMRVYAQDQLGNDEEEMRRKHFLHFRSKANNMDELSRDLQEAKAVAIFAPEIDNMRAAYEWSFANDPAGCLALMRGSGTPWLRLQRPEAQHLLRKALQVAPPAADLDHIVARFCLMRCLYRTRGVNDAGEQLKLLTEELSAVPAVDPLLQVAFLLVRSIYYVLLENLDIALNDLIDALALTKQYDLTGYQMMVLMNIGEILRQKGDFQGSIEYYESAISMSLGDPFWDSLAHFNLGSAFIQLNDVDRADKCFREALRIHRSVADVDIANAPLGGLGYVFVKRGRYREAGLLMGYPEARRAKVHGQMDPVDAQLFEHYWKLGSQLGGKEFDAAFATAAQLSSEDLERLIDETAPTAKDES